MVLVLKDNRVLPFLERHLSEDLKGVWLTNIDSDILFDADRQRGLDQSLKILALQPFIRWFGTMDTRYIKPVNEAEFGDAFGQDTSFAALGIDPLKT